jgi:hypothetical protein
MPAAASWRSSRIDEPSNGKMIGIGNSALLFIANAMKHQTCRALNGVEKQPIPLVAAHKLDFENKTTRDGHLHVF